MYSKISDPPMTIMSIVPSGKSLNSLHDGFSITDVVTTSSGSSNSKQVSNVLSLQSVTVTQYSPAPCSL